MSKLKSSELRRVAPIKVWVFCLLTTLVALALSNSVEMLVERKINHMHLIIASSIGALLGCGGVLVMSRLYGTGEHVPFFEVFPPRKDLAKILLWSFILATLLSIFSELMQGDIRNIVKETGWLFEVVFAVFTVVGLWLAYGAILEAKRIITTFDDLYDRVLHMAEETIANKEYKNLRILAYTPAIGFLALPYDRWSKLRADLMQLSDALEVICLDDEDLQYWHNQYVGRQTKRKAIERIDGSLGIADTQDATGESERLMKYPDVKENSARKCLEMMPGFYLIFNKVKAIIVAPLFIPFPVGTLTSVQQQTQKRVQMLGFETSDKRIIEDVTEFFEHYKDTVPSRPLQFDTKVGDVSKLSTLLMGQIETLKTGPLASEPVLRYRLSVFKAERWEEDAWQKILYYLESYKKVDAQNYETWLRPTCFDHSENSKIFVRVPNRESELWIRENCEKWVLEAMNRLQLGFAKVAYVIEAGGQKEVVGNQAKSGHT
jgi:hypothetical protein